jgi:hypothetical protein
MSFLVRKSGFALISVLALVSVLAILLGALIGTNRTAFALLGTTAARDRIDRTVSSVYSYCRYRLEHDYLWAKAEFEGSEPVVWGHLRVRELPGSGDVKIVQGVDLANGTSFEVEICNNLKSDGEVAVLKDIAEGQRRTGVPVGFCRFIIKAQGSGQCEGAEVMVRNPGLVGGVCLANDCLLIDSLQLDLITKDPIKNQARSLGQTKLTGIENFLSGQSLSVFPARHTSKQNPVIWSGTANEFRLDDSQEFRLREPFKAANPDLNFQDSRFVDGAETLFDVPDVDLADLEQVRSVATGQDKPVKAVEPGLYRFEQVGNPPVRVFTRRALTGNGLEDTSGPILEYWWMEEQASGRTDIRDLISIPAQAQGHKHAWSQNDQYVSINAAGGGGANVDLRNRRLVFDSEFNFEVDGDFSLIGSSINGDDSQRQVNPAVLFADPELIDNARNYNVGDAANLAGRDREKGSLRSSGAINIQGDINGSTTLAAKGDVTLALGRFFDPDGNADVNFSVFSEGNVAIIPPPILEDVDDRNVDVYFDENGDEVVSVSEANGVNCAEKNLRFTGMIYAQGNVDIDLQDTKNEQGARRNLFVEGSIVAKDGHLSIVNAHHLELIYNPQFVDRLLPGIANTAQRRIEATGWRTIKPEAFAVSGV